MNRQAHQNWLQEKAVSLEKSRKSFNRKNTTYKGLRTTTKILKLVSFVASVVAAILMIFLPPVGFGIAVAVVALYFLITKMESAKSPQQQFVKKLKHEIIPQIFEKVNPKLTYLPEGFNKVAVEQSGILNQIFFAKTIDIYGEDHAKGKIDNVEIEFFELKFFKNEVNYGKSGLGCLANIFLIPAQFIGQLMNGESYGVYDLADMRVVDANVFYSGMFLYADFHKKFTGEVLMIPKQQERLEDKLFKLLVPNHLQKIMIENSTIQANYNTYASEEQLGYYVLSTNLIDRVEQLSAAENALPILSFKNGKLYMMIPWSKDYFSADLKQPIEGSAYFNGFFEQVESFEKIVKHLNLDTRIWSKT